MEQQITDIEKMPEITSEEAEKMGLKSVVDTTDSAPPPDVWIPNRAERRAMKRNSKKAINNMLAGNKFARGSALVDRNTRQELYKAAYEKLKDFKTEEYRHQAKG